MQRRGCDVAAALCHWLSRGGGTIRALRHVGMLFAALSGSDTLAASHQKESPSNGAAASDAGEGIV